MLNLILENVDTAHPQTEHVLLISMCRITLSCLGSRTKDKVCLLHLIQGPIKYVTAYVQVCFHN